MRTPTFFVFILPALNACWWAVMLCLVPSSAAGPPGAGEVTFGPQQTITSLTNAAVQVIAADLDGDGDLDVLSASNLDDKIAWYENMDGLGAFGAQQVISNSVDRPSSVFAADLDGDGDPDVLSGSQRDDTIVWFENTDGLGAFGPPRVIWASDNFPIEVITTDVDGDGDQDVLSASCNGVLSVIAWYENMDGLGAFGAPRELPTPPRAIGALVAADLDGDGDSDVLSAGRSPTIIVWHENSDGAGAFGPPQLIATDLTGPFESLIATDLDGDGDNDVVSRSGALAWYENTDGQGVFVLRQTLTTESEMGQSVFAADLDGDGDPDLVSATTYRPRLIMWYENLDGLGAFGPHRVITTTPGRPWSVYAADLDGDGDSDVLSALLDEDKIIWNENLAISNSVLFWKTYE